MVTAHILVCIQKGHTRELIEELKNIDEVKEIFPVSGDTDLIVKMEADSMDDIHSIVIDRLEGIGYIQSTKTQFAISKLQWKRE